MNVERTCRPDLPTHEVINTPPHIADQNLWAADTALQSWSTSQGAAHHDSKLANAGRRFGTVAMFEKAEQTNRFPLSSEHSTATACASTK